MKAKTKTCNCVLRNLKVAILSTIYGPRDRSYCDLDRGSQALIWLSRDEQINQRINTFLVHRCG